jgi:hypothetical protein
MPKDDTSDKLMPKTLERTRPASLCADCPAALVAHCAAGGRRRRCLAWVAWWLMRWCSGDLCCQQVFAEFKADSAQKMEALKKLERDLKALRKDNRALREQRDRSNVSILAMAEEIAALKDQVRPSPLQVLRVAFGIGAFAGRRSQQRVAVPSVAIGTASCSRFVICFGTFDAERVRVECLWRVGIGNTSARE